MSDKMIENNQVTDYGRNRDTDFHSAMKYLEKASIW